MQIWRVLLAISAVSGSAQAYTLSLGGTTVAGQGQVTSHPYSYQETFDRPNGTCGLTSQLGIPFDTKDNYFNSGGVIATKYYFKNRYSYPVGDTGCFAALGNSYLVSQLTVSPSGADYVGLYIGSLDEYNIIEFDALDAGGVSHPVVQLNGVDIATALNIPLYSSAYLNFAFDDSELVTSLYLSSTNYALEFDNLAVHARYNGQVFVKAGPASVGGGESLASLIVSAALAWRATRGRRRTRPVDPLPAAA